MTEAAHNSTNGVKSGLAPHETDGTNGATAPNGGNPTTVPETPSAWTLSKWMLQSTREVLPPLLGSAVARICDQFAGISLFMVPIVLIANAFSHTRNGCVLGTEQTVGLLVSVMVVIALVKGLARYLEHFLGHLVAFRALEILRGQAFRAIYPQAPALEFRTHSGDMLARLTKDIDRIEVFFAHTFAPAVSSIVVPVTVAAVSFTLVPWPLAVAVTLVLAVGLAIPWVGIRAGHRAALAKLAVRGEVSTHVTDSLGGLAEVVGYGLEQPRLRGMARVEARLLDRDAKNVRIRAFREAFLLAWRMVTLVVLLTVGGWLFMDGQVSLAAWLAVVFATLRSWEVLQGVVDFGADLNVSFAAAARVWKLSHEGLELASGEAPVPAGALGLEYRDVSFSYGDRLTLGGAASLDASRNSGKNAESGLAPHETETSETVRERIPAGVRGVNFEVKPGSWTAVVGATGSGKSTLARLALRFFDPQAGAVRLAGGDLREYRLDEVRRAVSLVSVDTKLFDMTVGQNLRLAAPDASDDDLWEALRLAAIDQEIREMGGLERRVGGRGDALSGGQRQRLSLAQALLRGSRILILDEYTAHLNPELSARIAENLRALPEHPTILEITHSLDRIDAADWVAVLDLGRIVEQGKPEDLLSHENSALRHLRG